MNLSRIRPLIAVSVAIALVFGCRNATTASDIGAGGPNGGATGSSSVVHEGIEYAATLEVMESFPVQIAARVTMTNRSDAPETVVFPDGCIAMLRVYADVDAAPVWDQQQVFACTMALVSVELSSGESESFTTPTSSAADILGGASDLPDGTYRVTIYLRPDGSEVEIDGGETELAIPR